MIVVISTTLWLAGELAAPPVDPTPILNGEVAGACDWPSAVLMSGCSGTLVHPEIVIYAAHCGNTGTVRFGTTGGERSAGTDYCRDAPLYPAEGWDFAYCKLSNPVTDVPIAPVLMGCEWEQLQVGTEVWMASFGQTSNAGGGFGTKRFVRAEVAGFPSNGKKIGFFYADMETGICSGDSGGANFVQLEDGTWRMFGITVTTAGSCGGTSQSTPVSVGIEWLEEDSGIDITPCHDADGAWNPGPDCGAFPADIEDGTGKSWGEGCGPGALGEPSTTCGPGAGDDPDSTPPTIAIETPADGTYDGPTFRTPIEIAASDDWGILEVTVEIDGAEIAVLKEEPYVVGNVDLPEGILEITATARDWSGNLADATPVVIEVGDGDSETGTPPGDSDDPGGSESGGGDSESGDPRDTTTSTDGDAPDPTSEGGDPDSDSDSPGADPDPDGSGAQDGCACTSTPRGAGTGWLVFPVLMVRRRRPTAAGSTPTGSCRSSTPIRSR